MTDTLTAPESLRRLGWSAADEDRWNGHGAPARVIVNHGSICEVMLAGADGRLVQHAATPAPALSATPVAGDWVELGADGRVHAVAPRRAVLSRAGAAGSGPQVMAADIDAVLNARMVERLSVMGWESGAQPVLVLSKADRTRDEGADDTATAELLSPAYPSSPSAS